MVPDLLAAFPVVGGTGSRRIGTTVADEGNQIGDPACDPGARFRRRSRSKCRWRSVVRGAERALVAGSR